MKARLSLVAIAVALVASVGLSAQTMSRIDSANYTLGVANGDGIRRYVLKEDTADSRKVAAFVNGFSQTFGLTAGPDFVVNAATRMGYSLSQEINSGFIFGDSTIKADAKLITSLFALGINGGAWTMSDDEAMQYVQNVMGNSMYTKEPVNPTKAQTDTLNMCVGLLNARQARTSLGADTSAKSIKLYMRQFGKALKLRPDSIQERIYFGMNIGDQFNRQFTGQPGLLGDSTLTIDYATISRGAVDCLLQRADMKVTPEQANQYLQHLQQEIQERRVGPLRRAGEEFLAANAKRPEVKTTPSGLQYEVVKEGQGERPQATSKVRVHYTGKLIDGKVFDSSVERGEPLEFELNRVIRGWQEGLQLMTPGSKYILYIPYNLGYGERGAGDLIPPYSALIFEVELLSIL